MSSAVTECSGSAAPAGGSLWAFFVRAGVHGVFVFRGTCWGSGSFAGPSPCFSAFASVTRSSNSPASSAIAACSGSEGLAGVRSGPSLSLPASAAYPCSGAPAGALARLRVLLRVLRLLLQECVLRVHRRLLRSRCVRALRGREAVAHYTFRVLLSGVVVWILGASGAAGGTGLVPYPSSAASPGIYSDHDQFLLRERRLLLVPQRFWRRRGHGP